jgi:hypothetical protein
VSWMGGSTKGCQIYTLIEHSCKTDLKLPQYTLTPQHSNAQGNVYEIDQYTYVSVALFYQLGSLQLASSVSVDGIDRLLQHMQQHMHAAAAMLRQITQEN